MTKTTTKKKIEVMVCGSVSNFNDDLVSFCSNCNSRIFVRPYLARHKARWCFSCVGKLFDRADICGDLVVSKDTIDEVRKRLKKFWIK